MPDLGVDCGSSVAFVTPSGLPMAALSTFGVYVYLQGAGEEGFFCTYLYKYAQIFSHGNPLDILEKDLCTLLEVCKNPLAVSELAMFIQSFIYLGTRDPAAYALGGKMSHNLSVNSLLAFELVPPSLLQETGLIVWIQFNMKSF